MTISEQVSNYIKKGKIRNALNLLEENTSDKDQLRKIILLESQLYELEMQEDLGLDAPILKEKTRIKMAVLRMADEFDETPSTPQNDNKAFENLLLHLEMTYNMFVAQNRIRNKLVAMLRKRIPNLEYKTLYDLLSDYFPQMTEEEKREHKIIRGYTQNVIREHNYKALEIIMANPTMKDALPRIKDLEFHLTIWKSKFESTFIHDESVALVYVGVEEKVRFPIGIEDEIRTFLKEK